MKFVSQTSPSAGIPLGGLGTGSVEIRPDGCLHEWLIFNNEPWAGYGPLRSPVNKDDLTFIMRVKGKGEEPVLRLLRTTPWDDVKKMTYNTSATVMNPYHTPWIKPVEKISFEGRPPLAVLNYHDRVFEEVGLKVNLKAFGPLVPNDVRTSSIPAAIFTFHLENVGRDRLEVSLMALMRNPHTVREGVKGVNRIVTDEGFVALEMGAEHFTERDRMYGGSLSIAILGEGTGAAGITVKRDHEVERVHKLRRILVDFREDGHVEGGLEAEALDEDLYGALTKNLVLGPKEEEEVIFLMAWFYPNHIDLKGRRLGHFYERFLGSSLEVIRYVARNLDEIRNKVLGLVEALYDASYEDWLKDLGASQITTLIKSSWLTKEGLFGIWEGGPGCCGLNTIDVMLWALPGLALLYPQLAKNFIKHVSRFLLTPSRSPHYELLALSFPENMELYRRRLREDPSIQHNVNKLKGTLKDIIRSTRKDPSGRVPHLFRSSFNVVDGYDRVDLMPEYVLMASLLYLWTGDEKFIKDVWPSMKRVIDALLKQHDELGTRLPYHSPPSGYEGFSRAVEELAKGEEAPLLRLLLTGPAYTPISVNTFDALSLIGLASFTSNLWIAALSAAAKVAEGLNDPSSLWLRRTCEVAKANFCKYLWNGEYFELWFDPRTKYRDRACMSAALTGEWYSKVLMGLEGTVDREKVLSTLEAVYKYNFKRWEGLLNATYPAKPRPSLKGDMRYFNEVGIGYLVGGQMDTPWTGIEISVALHMIWEGMIEEGLSLLKSVHERYLEWGLYWNHIECGGHYLRALCSLLIFNVLAGARYLAPQRTLELGPRVGSEYFKGPVLVPGALLVCEIKKRGSEKAVTLKCKAGSFTLERLVIRGLGTWRKVHVELNGSKRACRCLYGKDVMTIIIGKTELKEGDMLYIGSSNG